MSSARSASLTILTILGWALASGCTPSPASHSSTSAEQLSPSELLRNGRMTADGMITGGQPTPEQLSLLSRIGYRTVVNLRLSDEPGSTNADLVETLGMQYAQLPIEGAAALTEANARRLAEVLRTADAPVVVHCASGNRVGALLALMAYHVDGKTPTQALAIGQAAGLTRLEPAVRERLGLPVEP